MAYVDQERKARLAANLKKVIPAGWKYSLAVSNYSTIVLTISAAPVDLCAEYQRVVNEQQRTIADFAHYGIQDKPQDVRVNHHWLEHQFDGDLLVTFQAIKDALNDGNHDRSDLQTDYFDVGWYIDIRIGRWNKPFRYLEQVKEAA